MKKTNLLLAASIAALLSGCGGGGSSTPAAPANTAPSVTIDATVTTNEDTAKVITTASLLANDTDADGDTLSVSSIVNATNGTATLNTAKTEITFTPNANSTTAGVITYKVSDGTDTTDNTITVNVTAVNDAPTSTQIAATATATNTNKTVSTTVQDVDGDALTYWAVSADTNRVTVTPTAASKGSVSATDALSGKSVDFVANPVAGVNGNTVITYYVSDGTAANVSKTFTLTVNASGSLPASASTVNE